MKRCLFIAYAVISLSCSISCGVRGNSKAHLEFEQVSIKAPFTVRTKGPDQLLEHFKGQYGKWIGCGYSIQWGDGPYSNSPNGAPPQCSEGFEHTYAKPGSYKVKATIYHTGPADELIHDWSDTVVIDIKEK